MAPTTSSGGAAITGYNVQYKLNSASSWHNDNSTSSTGTSKIITGLTENTLYNFRVNATNSAGSAYFAVDPGMTRDQGAVRMLDLAHIQNNAPP